MDCNTTIPSINLYTGIKTVIDKLSNSKKIHSVVQEHFPTCHPDTAHLPDDKIYVYLIDDHQNIHQEVVLKILGTGGSKAALDISHGKALLVPNMVRSEPELVKYNWERISVNEVYMSHKLRCIGLLSPESKLVGLSFSPDVDKNYIPAFVSTSFDALKDRGCFFLDCKGGGDTWEIGENYLFSSDEERFNESKWDDLVSPLLTDIAKICIYNVPVNRDSLHLAIIKKQDLNEYQVRYFGFDYSGKSPFLPEKGLPSQWFLPEIAFRQPEPNFDPEDINYKWRKMKIHETIKKCLPEFLDTLFHSEFHTRYGLSRVRGNNDEEKIDALKRHLITKYTEEIFYRLQNPELYKLSST